MEGDLRPTRIAGNLRDGRCKVPSGGVTDRHHDGGALDGVLPALAVVAVEVTDGEATAVEIPVQGRNGRIGLYGPIDPDRDRAARD